MIEVEEIASFYIAEGKKKAVLKNASFALNPGKITAFVGKSGAGKTTLLKCMGGLLPYTGKILWEGKNLQSLHAVERAKTIGFVFQQFHLFPHFTVLQNCTYALEAVLGMKQGAFEKAKEVLSFLGMGSFLHALPSQLSGGQQQRVAIARALVLEPKVLLLDEPTSALDTESKKGLSQALLALAAKGVTLGFSSHDIPFVESIADVIYVVEEGKILTSV